MQYLFAKANENQRIEAYKTYMSDSLVFCNTILSRNKVEIPRYHDLIQANKEQEKEEDPADIIARMKSKADNLRG